MNHKSSQTIHNSNDCQFVMVRMLPQKGQQQWHGEWTWRTVSLMSSNWAFMSVFCSWSANKTGLTSLSWTAASTAESCWDISKVLSRSRMAARISVLPRSGAEMLPSFWMMSLQGLEGFCWSSVRRSWPWMDRNVACKSPRSWSNTAAICSISTNLLSLRICSSCWLWWLNWSLRALAKKSCHSQLLRLTWTNEKKNIDLCPWTPSGNWSTFVPAKLSPEKEDN